MKIRNSSRVTALVLALVMILPVISIPAFAEEADPNLLWSEDYEGRPVGDYTAKADANSSAKIQQANGNKYWEIPFFGYKNGVVAAFECECGYWDGKSAAEGSQYDDNVSKCKCKNVDKNFIVDTDRAYSAVNYDVVVFSADYFIPADAHGHITSQFRTVDGTLTEGGVDYPVSGVSYFDLYSIDYTADRTNKATSYAYFSSNANAVYYYRDVPVGQWVTISVAIDLDACSFEIYIDDVLAATVPSVSKTVSIGGVNRTGTLSNITIPEDKWTVYKTTDSRRADKNKDTGATYIDNLKICSGTASLAQSYLYKETFEKLPTGVDLNETYNTTFGNRQSMDGLGSNTGYLPKLLKAVSIDGNKALSMQIEPTTSATKYVACSNSKGGTAYIVGEVTKTTQEGVAGVLYNSTFYATTAANGQQYESTFKVGDTTYYVYTEKACEIDGGGITIDMPISATNGKISYKKYDSIVFEARYFIPANFNARIETQLRGYATGESDAYAQWLSLVYIYGDGTKAYLQYSNSVKDTATLLNLDAWNTVSLVYNLDTGAYTAYVNGLKTTVTGTNKAQLTVLSNSWLYAKVFKDYQDMSGDNILIDDVAIYEATAPRAVSTDIYYNGFEQYEAGSTVVANPYIYYAYQDSAANEKAATIDATKGSNALKLFYQSAKDANGTNRTFYNVDKNFKLANPKLSYTDMDSVVFDFNVFIPATSSGAIHVRYGNANASGDYYYKQGAENVIIKDGEGNAKAVNNEQQAWTPDLFRLEYYTAGQDAIFSAVHNDLIETASVKVNEWATLSVVVNLKDATVTGYANGVLVYTGAIKFQKSMQDRTVDGNLGYKFKVGGNDVVAYAYTEDETTIYKKADGTVVTPDAETTPAVYNVWYWLKNPSNVTLNASQLLITGFANMKNKNGVGGDLLVDDIAIYEGNTPKNAVFVADDFAGIVETEEKTQVRLSTKSGLRFATEIDTDMLADLQALEGIQNVKIGTLIAPERYLTAGTELTVDSLTRAGKAMLKVEATIDNYYTGNIDEDPNTTHFVGSIVDILPTNIAQNFCARGYVEITMDSGLVVYIYSETIATQNVQDAADAVVDLIGEENLVETYGETYAQILLNYQAGLPADAQ